jgi:DNA-directed RNA polymerase subunit RPC12/RpoP
MALWVLRCVNCDKTFPHSVITYTDSESYVLPVKPKFEPTEHQCPHCDHKSLYGRTSLIYEH